MPHNTTIQPVIDELPRVAVASFDLFMTQEEAVAFRAGALKLMSTKAGLSTTLVDPSHTFVSQAGLVKRVGVGAGVDIITPPRNLIKNRAAHPGQPAVAVVAGLALLGAGGTLFLLHMRKKAKLASGSYSSGDERVLADAEEIVDAESVRLRQAAPNAVVADLRQLHLLMTNWVRRL